MTQQQRPIAYRGQVRPWRPKRSAVPVYQKYAIMGVDGKLFSKFRIWVHKPTLDYPTVNVFISLTSGAGSAFCRATIAELKQLRDLMTQWCTELDSLAPVLEQEQQNITKYREAMDLMQAAAQMQSPPTVDPTTGELIEYTDDETAPDE